MCFSVFILYLPLSPLNSYALDGELLFRVKIEHLSLKVSSDFAKDKNSDQIVEIYLPGKLYEPHIKINEIERENTNLDTPEKSSVSLYSANRRGDAEWMKEIWSIKDQDHINKFIKEFLPQNTEIFQKLEKAEIVGKVYYRNFVLVLIEYTFLDGKVSKMVHLYVKSKNGWKITNSLANDEVRDVISAAFSSGTVIARQ